MTFKKFITTSEFSDTDIKTFQNWFLSSKFPSSNKPEVHTLFLSMHLDSLKYEIVMGYKKGILAYSTYPKNVLS